MKEEKLSLDEVEKALNTLMKFSTTLYKYESIIKRIGYQFKRFEGTTSNFSFTPEGIMRMLLSSGAIKLPTHNPNIEEINLKDKEAEKIIKKLKRNRKKKKK